MDLVVVGVLYMACPDGCIYIPAKANAIPHDGAAALVLYMVGQVILLQLQVACISPF